MRTVWSSRVENVSSWREAAIPCVDAGSSRAIEPIRNWSDPPSESADAHLISTPSCNVAFTSLLICSYPWRVITCRSTAQHTLANPGGLGPFLTVQGTEMKICLLYTSDAADE